MKHDCIEKDTAEKWKEKYDRDGCISIKVSAEESEDHTLKVKQIPTPRNWLEIQTKQQKQQQQQSDDEPEDEEAEGEVNSSEEVVDDDEDGYRWGRGGGPFS